MKEEDLLTSSLPDGVLLALYRNWSEEFYCASFITPSKDNVEAFRRWLGGLTKPAIHYEDYELEFLKEYQQQVKRT